MHQLQLVRKMDRIGNPEKKKNKREKTQNNSSPFFNPYIHAYIHTYVHTYMQIYWCVNFFQRYVNTQYIYIHTCVCRAYIYILCVCSDIVTDLHFGANITPKEVSKCWEHFQVFFFKRKSTLRNWNLGVSKCWLQKIGKLVSKCKSVTDLPLSLLPLVRRLVVTTEEWPMAHH